MADFEDATTPSWDNLIEGQANLIDAVRREIIFDDPETGRHYALNDKTAVLFVRPRGWHLPEKHILVDGDPMSGALFDFGLFLFHNAKELLARGTGPYFYLPKIESHLEARLWNDVFLYAQGKLGLPKGTIRATVLIETIMAAFEMDEILWELRDHSAGLNCGRWDYIYSFIKKFAEDPACVMPDRGQVTMTSHFLRSYSLLLIKTCHRREIHAMGGMAAQIPIREDPAANEAAMTKVRADKEREAGDGHDGTWVAHPGLVAIAKEAFDREMPQPNQIARKRQDVHIAASDLLAVPHGTITEAGLRQNVNVGIGYIDAWLRGTGCVPLYHLMEDAATAEISRAQIWQWIRHRAKLEDGRIIDAALCCAVLDEELEKLRESAGGGGRYEDAAKLFRELIEAPTFAGVPNPARLRHDHGRNSLERGASAGGVVAAAAKILIRAIILPGIVVRTRVVLVAAGPAGIGARVITSSTGVTTRKVASGVATASGVAIVIIDDRLAESWRHPCACQAAGVMVAE